MKKKLLFVPCLSDKCIMEFTDAQGSPDVYACNLCSEEKPFRRFERSWQNTAPVQRSNDIL